MKPTGGQRTETVILGDDPSMPDEAREMIIRTSETLISLYNRARSEGEMGEVFAVVIKSEPGPICFVFPWGALQTDKFDGPFGEAVRSLVRPARPGKLRVIYVIAGQGMAGGELDLTAVAIGPAGQA